MFAEFMAKTFYGNTITQWAIALGIIVGAFVVGKALYWVFGSVVRKLTAKTKTRLDDIIVDMIEEPVVLALTIIGIWYGLRTLALPEATVTWTQNVILVLVVLTITWLVARLLESLFAEYIVPLAAKSATDLDDQLLPIVRKGTKFTVWGVGIMVALNNAGYDVTALIAGLGIGGLALAMAAKDTVSNVFGGFTIFTDRPFTINDRVQVGGFDGYVREIGVRSTRLETLAGRTVTIPNSTFADSAVENLSVEPSRKVVLNLGLTYDTTPEQMQEAMGILREIATGHDSLEEKVLVGFDAFGDFAMNIFFAYYIKKGEEILQTQTDINMAILSRFNQAGLEFAFPTQTLFTKELEA